MPSRRQNHYTGKRNKGSAMGKNQEEERDLTLLRLAVAMIMRFQDAGSPEIKRGEVQSKGYCGIMGKSRELRFASEARSKYLQVRGIGEQQRKLIEEITEKS